MYKMKKLLSLLTLPLLLGALPSPSFSNSQVGYEVTPQYGVEGNYSVRMVIGSRDRQRGILLDCPTGKYTYWDTLGFVFVTKSIQSGNELGRQMSRICLQQGYTPGIGRR